MDIKQIEKAIETRKMICSLEEQYSHELDEGYGIHSEYLKDYVKIRTKLLLVIEKMKKDGFE